MQADASLPPGWRWVRLDTVSELLPSKSLSTRGDTVVYAVTTACLTELGFDPAGIKTARMLAEDAADCVVGPGEVLIARSNTPQLVGRAAVYAGGSGEIVASDLTIRVKPGSQLDPQFLGPFLSLLYLSGYWISRAGGASGSMKKITRSQVQAIEVPLPPLPEQRRIAAIVTEQMATVERARVALEEQIEAAGELPSAYMRGVFESQEARNWPRSRLGEVGEIGSGITLGRKLKPSDPVRSVPYLRVANVKDGYLDLSDVKEVLATEAEIQRCQLRHGDLLLTEGGDPDKLGRGTFWKEEIPGCIHQNHIFRVRFDQTRFCPEFLSAQIGSPYGKAYFLAHAKQTTGIATINRTVLSNFPLMVPPLAVQKRVSRELSERLESAARLRTALESQLAEINALPGALLRRAFAGEL